MTDGAVLIIIANQGTEQNMGVIHTQGLAVCHSPSASVNEGTEATTAAVGKVEEWS